ncbi:30S ribosomal protein S17 [Tuwongella immobilis]|uniref:Small ribosomal subunit protein uS17 n=1 Tax=Tuwongella immobilis TaxID=692036 RepID=A0A6C2YMU6_9BACT|nr:30S ribosomal protein S17 [Tuwongella immobilis]VIP02697.1 30s ribosomal protein s17 : 30S ribosomal protein S17 OS=Isosphaera pallida (strain ATCC 43644 / DSM 9630 / IS1B) GN=rpsQ PE=3 SV=1: Ribosomal_S17 [Tuwongella immobilis]VTS02180.1 30s ribosomal protein s17 : 30S ribosomal protein S17 OS=Isosphaera pallida (strain ATCC 43644 / DSM 9630 / IS1B) GN=rpsQ PE=3 SV=1: Ribosomal_S17 [Tuwongella immobilis]
MSEDQAAESTTVDRNARRVLIGVVTRDKMNKTRRVEIQRLVKHARYGKYIKRRTVCYTHDEANTSRIGDVVEIMETRPLSKLKNWRLIRVVTKAPVTKIVKTEAASAS